MMEAIIPAFMYREASETYLSLQTESNSILACLLILSDMWLILILYF